MNKRWEAKKTHTDHYDADVKLETDSGGVFVYVAGTPQRFSFDTGLALAAWLIAVALESKGKTAKDVQIMIK